MPQIALKDTTLQGRRSANPFSFWSGRVQESVVCDNEQGNQTALSFAYQIMILNRKRLYL